MRSGVPAFLAGLVLVAVAGCAAQSAGAEAQRPATTRAPATTAGAPASTQNAAEAARDFRSPRGYQATPVPVRVAIPRIGVDSSIDRLGRAGDGTIEVPERFEVAGWYELGPRPGDPGSAVILGHVDSKSGPAVFYRLRELRHGDVIVVTRADGSLVRFVVDRIGQYDKRRFPTDEVYYPTLTPALRLVTCGGQFDPAAGHYRSNVIVFATSSGPTGP